jgi:excisionase family DNA binding protein
MNENKITNSLEGQTALREFETKKQLAERLAISVRSVDNLLARGLPHIRITRKLVRFPCVAVNEWLAERQVRRV